MDRQNLLVYLQNIRDLEVKRAGIVRQWRTYLLRSREEKNAAEGTPPPWNDVDEQYFKKCEQAAAALRELYSMDILPNQFRNLKSVLYLCDYLSSSQMALEEALIHAHIEDGMERCGMDKPSCVVP